MKEKKFELVVDNTENFKKEGGRDKPSNSKKSLSEKFFDGVDTMSISEFNTEGMPDILKNSIKETAEKIEKSAESFDKLYNEKISELKRKIQTIRDLLEKKQLSMKAQIHALKSVDDTEKWIIGTERAYDFYDKIPGEKKKSIMAQNMREALTESFDEIINSLSAIEEALSRAPQKL